VVCLLQVHGAGSCEKCDKKRACRNKNLGNKNQIFEQQVLLIGNQGSSFLNEIPKSGDHASESQENGGRNDRRVQPGFQ
jgi:hypothetical protein